jgi:hypothetical protein
MILYVVSRAMLVGLLDESTAPVLCGSFAGAAVVMASDLTLLQMLTG